MADDRRAVASAGAEPDASMRGGGARAGGARAGKDGGVLAAVLSPAPISLEEAVAAVESDVCGAVVSFSGVIRNHDGGKHVSRLSYSAHPTAQAVLSELAAETARAHAGVRLWVGHRIGDLAIGDAALVCAAAAAHRRPAFEACSDLVERVKAQVPIWKEQFFDDGTVEWVGIGQ